jgi:hypothetical protein
VHFVYRILRVLLPAERSFSQTSFPGVDDNCFAADAFFPVRVKGAGHGSASSALLYHFASHDQFGVYGDSLEELDVEGPCPSRGELFRRSGRVQVVFSTVSRERGPGRVAVDERGSHSPVEVPRIRAMMFRGLPSGNKFVALHKALQFEPAVIVRAAAETVTDRIIFVEKVLKSSFSFHIGAPAFVRRLG